MYLRTNNFTVCILIHVRDNDSILHSAGFDLCLSRQNMPFSILPASDVFKIYFTLLKLTKREHYTCVAVLHFTNINPILHLNRSDWYLNLVSYFCFIQRHCFLIAILNVLVHQAIDKQANVIHILPMSYVT